jgi:hypothetical protein
MTTQMPAKMQQRPLLQLRVDSQVVLLAKVCKSYPIPIFDLANMYENLAMPTLIANTNKQQKKMGDC